MRHERATEELKERAALYALGSLTQQEARSFEIHLKDECSVCQSEYEKFSHAVAEVGFAAAEAAAPEYVRDLLSARIDREKQIAPRPVLPSAAGGKSETREEAPRQEISRPTPALPVLSQPRTDGPKIFPWVLVVALAVLGLVAFFAWRSANEMNTQLEARISAAQVDSEDMRTKLENRENKAADFDRIAGTVAKPGVRIARLIDQTVPPKFSAAVIWDTGQNRCLLLGNLPPAPDGKRYQLWFFTPAAKISAGQVSVGSEARMLASLSVPPDAAGASAAVLTLEPDNGSQIPTSPYFAVGRIE